MMKTYGKAPQGDKAQRLKAAKARKRKRRPGRVCLFIAGLLLAAATAGHMLPNMARATPAAEKGEGADGAQAATARLSVSPILQKPELPNGCEATALCTLLNYYGYSADKVEIAYEYIPREDFYTSGEERCGADPEEAYAGDPATTKGFYCFTKPVQAGANRFLDENASGLHCEDVSGATLEAFCAYLAEETPVMIWATLDYSDTVQYLDYPWTLPGGEAYIPYRNLHCVVLTGYGEGVFTVCDPLEGRIQVEQNALYESYRALGSRAAVII